MENIPSWHHGSIDNTLYIKAKKELKDKLRTL